MGQRLGIFDLMKEALQDLKFKTIVEVYSMLLRFYVLKKHFVSIGATSSNGLRIVMEIAAIGCLMMFVLNCNQRTIFLKYLD